MAKGKKFLAGREASDPRGLTMEDQEKAVLEAGGELEEEETTFQEEVVEEAEEQGVELHDVKGELDAAEQKSLPGMVPEKIATVRGSLMLAEFVRPHFVKEEGTRYCGLEFSLPLTKDHHGRLNKNVEDAWKYIEKRSSKSVVGIALQDQLIDIRIVPDDEVDLRLESANIVNASVSLIKGIGTGAEAKIVRFSFRAVVEATKDVYTFAAKNFGDSVWIEMKTAQIELDYKNESGH